MEQTNIIKNKIASLKSYINNMQYESELTLLGVGVRLGIIMSELCEIDNFLDVSDYINDTKKTNEIT